MTKKQTHKPRAHPPAPQTATLSIERFGTAGEGIAHLNGQVVFVSGALPGETCLARLDKVGKQAIWATAEHIETPSPHRIAPDCPWFSQCGGCQFRHMSYAAELEAKRQRVEDAFLRIGGLNVCVAEIIGAEDTTRYRNKVQFPVAEGPKIGFYQAKSHRVVDVDDCLLQPQQAAVAAQVVRRWMRTCHVPAYHERTHTGLIRHVFLRFSGADTLCCLVANGHTLPQQAQLIAALRDALPTLRGVVLSVNCDATNVVLGRKLHVLWGDGYLEDTLCGLTFRISPLSFYQVNRAQTQVLYQRAVEAAALTGCETVLDLYCGIGTISLVMAAAAKRVIGAEIIPDAVTDARENAARNGIENAEFFCGDAGQAAQKLAGDGLQPDVICVDPPRKGLAPEVIDAIAAMSPQRVVYVSCDPATLARDAARLAAHGYHVKTATAVDMFPRTAHVETVVLLSRKTPNDVIHVDLELEELDVTAAEAKATYQEIKDYVLEKYGFKVSQLYIAQVKRKHGIIERENYNTGEGKAKVPQVPADKEKAIEDALRYFEMI